MKRYALAASAEELKRPSRFRETLVDAYRDHLRRRRAEEPGVAVTRLLGEIRELGYTGSANLLVRARVRLRDDLLAAPGAVEPAGCGQQLHKLLLAELRATGKADRPPRPTHGSGLSVYRRAIERTIAWYHGMKRRRIRWERGGQTSSVCGRGQT